MKTIAAKSVSKQAPAKRTSLFRPAAPGTPQLSNHKTLPGMPPVIQRKSACPCDGGCPRCGNPVVIQPKPLFGQAETPEATPALRDRVESLKGGGQPLPASTRNYFEPRFGRDFSGVRVHSGSGGAETARDLNARAFTIGNDIVFGSGQYTPGTEAGNRLMAHELTHTIQQQKTPNRNPAITPARGSTVRRQTIHNSCNANRHTAITSAWGDARTLLTRTLNRLRLIRGDVGQPGGPARTMPTYTGILRRTFGNIGGLNGGGVHFLTPLIRNFERIRNGFISGHTVQCTATADSRCGLRGAFVDMNIRNTIFLCDPLFFNHTSRHSKAELLIHEMAHSVLRVGHDGFPGGPTADVAVAMLFDCASQMNLTYQQARGNAYAYQILVACLVGSQPTVPALTGQRGAAAPGATGAARPNTLGAAALVTHRGRPGARLRYGRVLLGGGTGAQMVTGANMYFLSDGNEIGGGAGLSFRYAWPYVYVQGGAALSGGGQLSSPTGTRRALRLDVIPGMEIGARLGILNIHAGYQVMVPLTSNISEPQLRHVFTGGISLEF